MNTKGKLFSDSDSDWAIALEPFDSASALDSDTKQLCAMSLAFLLTQLRQQIACGENEKATELLTDGLNELFLHSDVFHEGRAKFFLVLSGEEKPPPETTLISIPELERAIEEVVHALDQLKDTLSAAGGEV